MEAANGNEDGKEALEVFMGSIMNIGKNVFKTYIYLQKCIFSRSIQCFQDSEDDYGEKLPASHHIQLQ